MHSHVIDRVTFLLQKVSGKLFKCFACNQIKSNIDKCHLIASKNQIAEIQIGNFSIKCNSNVELLGVNSDSKLILIVMLPIYDLFSRAIKTLRALARVTLYMKL